MGSAVESFHFALLGMSMAVVSTVVPIRGLSGIKRLHTAEGHVAVGFLALS
jgi:predicted Kef-type K+ transport protein